jgi:tetratricopeptide (TPR) repeat protein
VRYVLEGSVRKADTRVRITAQLVEATTGHHLWSERYDRELKDIFALQDEIIQQIVGNLNVEVWQAELERVRRTPTNNLTAYDYLLRGMELSQRGTKETNMQARQMFEQALALDPQYAAAYAALGWAYFNEWFFLWTTDLAQSLEQAFEMAQRAMALNNSLSNPHLLLGTLYLWKKQHEQAITEAERAIALNPNYADGYVILAGILAFAGQPEEAIGLVEKAMRLNPRYPGFYLNSLGFAYRVARRYEEAITPLKRVLALDPNYVPAHVSLAICYAELGQQEEAQAEIAEVLRLNPNYSLGVWKQRLPFKDPAVLERQIDALRKAGLK